VREKVRKITRGEDQKRLPHSPGPKDLSVLDATFLLPVSSLVC
jgi:hypothetical protein